MLHRDAMMWSCCIAIHAQSVGDKVCMVQQQAAGAGLDDVS